MALATVLLIFNLTKIDYGTPLAGDSEIAVISVLASACALVLLLILQVSKKIAERKE